MNNGYIKIATFSPEIKVGDVGFNANQIIKTLKSREAKTAGVIIYPSLCLTGSTCAELFRVREIINSANMYIQMIAEYTKNLGCLVFLGAPINVENRVINACAVIKGGEILCFVPKNNLTIEEQKYFSALKGINYVKMKNYYRNEQEKNVIISENIILSDKVLENFKVAVEFDTDLDNPFSNTARKITAGARVIVNLSATSYSPRKSDEIKSQVISQSKRFCCIYALSNAGKGESSTDLVFGGEGVIAENGEILSQNLAFNQKSANCLADLDYIDFIRNKKQIQQDKDNFEYIQFTSNVSTSNTCRAYEKTPFIIEGKEQEMLTAQAQGLQKRIEHTNAKKLVIGLSGGLDSALALIASVNAMHNLSRDRKDIIAITMPCFGTTERTLNNSIALAKSFGVSLKKIDISKSVSRHLKDIKHSENSFDISYENAQARERTQVLMDVANMEGGLVVGTGDLSELALGWATYNGDHMSNYGVNASIPKTLVRHLVEYYKNTYRGKLNWVLTDILDTPVSPELLPSNENSITQKTEDVIGPYILHDFFLYNYIVRGFSPTKLYYVACKTFWGDFDHEQIKKWLIVFFTRFYSSQFKRSCLPDGVSISEVSLSPRGYFNMPSDAVAINILKDLERL